MSHSQSLLLNPYVCFIGGVVFASLVYISIGSLENFNYSKCNHSEKYTYNQNQPTVGISGQRLDLQPFNNFEPVSSEKYNKLYYHPAKENPQYNSKFLGV